jgi:threonyl-tRNA synthetase
LATIQCDFNLPERFDLSFTNEQGLKERPVVIHRAISGSLERFMGVLIEHFAGNFPAWLAPIQVAIIPVRENHEAPAHAIVEQLKSAGVRVNYMDASENMGKRVRKAKDMKTPYTIILGDKDIEAGMITVETRGVETGVQMAAEDFIQKITKEVKERSL